MLSLLQRLEKESYADDVHFRTTFAFDLVDVSFDDMGRVDPSSVFSAPAEDDGMTYCSKTAKRTLHALTGRPIAG